MISYFTLKGKRGREFCISFQDAGLDDGSTFVQFHEGGRPTFRVTASAIIPAREFHMTLAALVDNAGRLQRIPSIRGNDDGR